MIAPPLRALTIRPARPVYALAPDGSQVITVTADATATCTGNTADADALDACSRGAYIKRLHPESASGLKNDKCGPIDRRLPMQGGRPAPRRGSNPQPTV